MRRLLPVLLLTLLGCPTAATREPAEGSSWGDVPALLPGRQPCRDALNEAIRARCGPGKPCRVVSLDALHQEVLREGSIHYQGQDLTLAALLPDGLHLSDVASQYLAERLEDALRAGEP